MYFLSIFWAKLKKSFLNTNSSIDLGDDTTPFLKTTSLTIPSLSKKILMYGITEKEKMVMKTVLNYFGFLVPNEMPDIRFDLYTAKILKEMDNGS